MSFFNIVCRLLNITVSAYMNYYNIVCRLLNITVSVIIVGGIPHLVNTTTVTVHVNDVNDLSPWFLYTPYTKSVEENTNTSLLQVSYGPLQTKKCLRTCAKLRKYRPYTPCAKYHLGVNSPFIHFVVSNDSVHG